MRITIMTLLFISFAILVTSSRCSCSGEKSADRKELAPGTEGGLNQPIESGSGISAEQDNEWLNDDEMPPGEGDGSDPMDDDADRGLKDDGAGDGPNDAVAGDDEQ